jgi:hypothetical protein
MGDYNAVHQMLVRARDRLFALSRLLHPLDGRAAARVGGAPRARLADHLGERCADRPLEETMALLDAVGRALYD